MGSLLRKTDDALDQFGRAFVRGWLKLSSVLPAPRGVDVTIEATVPL